MTRFADGAGRLAGLAGWLLGWRPDEFWRATPAELASVLKAAHIGEPTTIAGLCRSRSSHTRPRTLGSLRSNPVLRS